MIYSIGTIPRIIVIVIIIVIMNHNSIPSTIMTTIIATMMIVIIMTINANCHYCKRCIIGRIIAVIIGWIVRHIHW